MKPSKALIEDMDLVAPLRNDSFSWSKSGNRPVASKINSSLLSKMWTKYLREVKADRLPCIVFCCYKESLIHFCLHCDLASKGGPSYLTCLGWSVVFPGGLMIGCLMDLMVIVLVEEERSFGDVQPILSFGCLWKERNRRMFEDKAASFDSFWAFAQHTASWWCTNYTKVFGNYSLLMNFNLIWN